VAAQVQVDGVVDGMGGIDNQEPGQRQGEPVMPDQGEQQGDPDAELEGAGVMHEVGVSGEAGGFGLQCC
jgi:hypothetical protein